MGRLSHPEEETRVLNEDRSGSSTQGDPQAGKHTGVCYLASQGQQRDGNTGCWAPRLGPMMPPFQAHGVEAGSRVQPDGVN